MWLIPQYFLISVAEIMFGVAGLEFSFTQAPKSMKTVTIASWYLSVAIGNLMVIVVAQANIFKSQVSDERRTSATALAHIISIMPTCHTCLKTKCVSVIC